MPRTPSATINSEFRFGSSLSPQFRSFHFQELELANKRLKEHEPAEGIAGLQEELISVKMREAEASLSIKEMRQRLAELEQQWAVSCLQIVFLPFCGSAKSVVFLEVCPLAGLRERRCSAESRLGARDADLSVVTATCCWCSGEARQAHFNDSRQCKHVRGGEWNLRSGTGRPAYGCSHQRGGHTCRAEGNASESDGARNPGRRHPVFAEWLFVL